MKHIIFILILLLSSGHVLGQDLSRDRGRAEIYGVFGVGFSKGSGNGPEILGGLNWNIMVPEEVVGARVDFVGQASAFKREKLYLNDGSGKGISFRQSARTYTFGNYSSLRPYAEVGYGHTHLWTSAYSKGGGSLFFGGGVNYADSLLIGYNYNLRDRSTFDEIGGVRVGNNTRGHTVYYEYYFSRLFVRGEANLFKFEQPPGYPNEGTHNSQSFRMAVGVRMN